ncbi:Rho GTPase activation protein [Suillus fuscotomentosus]|uniref:Rho GTPase activation protein n=1 Tax=Suillus fuscotomentosus TaxID=1912939 RepID=A0AAD4DSI9_9AGAM|nr:Rho GTPase activation protein [Suillus fuscotomentosus]KAG1893123.1 Rho GTPase activation protein [Suillus fuscotomentosus]
MECTPTKQFHPELLMHAQCEVEWTLEEVDPTEGHYPDDRKLQQYSNLFFLLQSEPRHIAALCRLGLVSLSEIDTLLQTVMFMLYGNQYESREEHLLLTISQSVLSAQFETATEFGSLLRANTPVSRMMTTYTRRGPGQSHLKGVLAERINSLIEHKDLNLEINPVKVYEQMINQIEEETVHYRPTYLAEYPQRKYGKCAVWYSMDLQADPQFDPGRFAFIFLSFDANPLIAKILQNLANKPSYAKEIYMITLNPFVENNKARINQFLSSLCEVGDFYDTLEMDQYMALSKKDLMIHITMNELYNTHSLILQHVETLVPRKENRAIELNLYSRWETPVQDIQSALMDSVSTSDMLYMETKSILVQLILRSIPHAAEKWLYNLAVIAEWAATTKDATLVRKGIEVKEMLRELDCLLFVSLLLAMMAILTFSSSMIRWLHTDRQWTQESHTGKAASARVQNQPLAVIGGGGSAAEEATYLTKYGSHVYVLGRRSELRVSKTMVKRLMNYPKITILRNTVATGCQGDGNNLRIKNVRTGRT